MLERLGINAKEAEKTLMVASSEKKNQALRLLKLTRLIWKMVKKTEWQSPCLTVLN